MGITVVAAQQVAVSLPPDQDSGYHLNGGGRQISGFVSELGVRGPYRVMLFERTGAPVAKTWSDASGAYLFQKLALKQYYVVAFDHGDNPVNAAISDYVTPEPMVRGYKLAMGLQANIPNAGDLTQWTLPAASAALNQIGVAGLADTATTLTDASTTAQGRAVSANTDSIAPGAHCWRMWIKKDPAATGYIPELQVVVNGAFMASVQVDIANGLVDGIDVAIRDGAECGFPDWWIVAVGYTTSATAPLAARVFAARRLTLGGAGDNTAVGSAVIGWVDILTDTTPTEALALETLYYV